MNNLPAYISTRIQLPCVCGHHGGVTTRRRDRYGLRFNYKLCLKCGHVRTSNPLREDAATTFYQSSDYRTMYFPGEEPRDVLMRKIPKPQAPSALLDFVRQFHVSPGHIVEWGCGGGWNLVPFRNAGWSVVGYDFDSRYVELGRDILGLDLREIQLMKQRSELLPIPDVVLLNHVLEHSVDPRALLEKLRDFSSMSTLIVVGIPLLETIRFWHWKPFFHIAHIHYFSMRTLKYVANLAELEVVHESRELGLFVLKRTRTSSASVGSPGRSSAMFSAVYLAAGFLDVRYWLRALARYVLKSLGLLSTARQARAWLRQ